MAKEAGRKQGLRLRPAWEALGKQVCCHRALVVLVRRLGCALHQLQAPEQPELQLEAGRLAAERPLEHLLEELQEQAAPLLLEELLVPALTEYETLCFAL